MLDLLKKIGKFRLDYNNWLLPLVFSGMSWVINEILPSIFLLSFPFFIPFFMGSKPIYRPLNTLPVFLEIPPLLLYLYLHLGHCLPPSLHAMLSRWRGYWQIQLSPPSTAARHYFEPFPSPQCLSIKSAPIIFPEFHSHFQENLGNSSCLVVILWISFFFLLVWWFIGLASLLLLVGHARVL